MHKIKYLSVIFFSLFIISCKSAGLPLILGSEKQTIDKIHVEYMNIGDTYLSLQQYDKAIEYYNKAMKNKELYWNCYYKIGKVYALKNQWEEASVYFKKLLERDPENSTLKASLAYIMASNNELLEAKEIYEEIILENQENQLYLENYISILFSLEKEHQEKLKKKLNKQNKEDFKLSEDNFKYETTIRQQIELLKELFPQSENINKFEKEFEALFNKKVIESEVEEPETEDSSTSEN